MSDQKLISPALVIALLALVVALAESAGAEPQFVERALSKSKVKEIADDVVTKRAPKLAVKSAKSANPVLFAHVLADGTVDASQSKGITQANVTPGSAAGYYCLDGLPFTPRGGQVTLDWNSTGSIDALVLYGVGDVSTCPTGNQGFVDIRNPDGTGSTPSAFFVTLYR